MKPEAAQHRLQRLIRDATASLLQAERCRELYERIRAMDDDEAGALQDDLGLIQHQQVQLYGEAVYALFERSGRRLPGQGLRSVRDLLAAHPDDIPVMARKPLENWLTSCGMTVPDTDAGLVRAVAASMVGPVLPMPSVIGVRILHDITFDTDAARKNLAGGKRLAVSQKPFPVDATAMDVMRRTGHMVNALHAGFVTG